MYIDGIGDPDITGKIVPALPAMNNLHMKKGKDWNLS